jgi:hypothetical protein
LTEWEWALWWEDVFRISNFNVSTFDFRFKKSAWKRQRNYSHTMTAERMFSGGFREKVVLLGKSWDINTLSVSIHPLNTSSMHDHGAWTALSIPFQGRDEEEFASFYSRGIDERRGFPLIATY